MPYHTPCISDAYFLQGSLLKENIAENWKTFKQAWSNYEIILNINQQSETYQVALILHCIGSEALKIFNGMSFDNAQEEEKLENIEKKLDEFTISETNKIYERYVLNSRNQSPDLGRLRGCVAYSLADMQLL